MQDVKREAVNPLAVFKESLCVWAGSLLPVVAFSCVSVFLARLLRLSKIYLGGFDGSRASWKASGILVLELVVFVVVNAVVSLLILSFIRMRSDGKKEISFKEAYQAAMKALAKYLKVIIALFLFAGAVISAGSVILALGQSYCATCGVSNVKMAVLLTTSTIFVVLVIALFWYGFFVSLAPLIAAFEGRDPFAAVRESRSRVKKHAGAYLATIVLFVALYILVGLSVYFVVTRFTSDRFILNMIDPAMAALLSPLWLAAWYTSYKKLSASTRT